VRSLLKRQGNTAAQMPLALDKDRNTQNMKMITPNEVAIVTKVPYHERERERERESQSLSYGEGVNWV